MNLNQSDSSVYQESVVALGSPNFPWDESRVVALSKRYMSARTDDAYHYLCAVNQVGTLT